MTDERVTAPITCYVIAMGDPFNGIELFGWFTTADLAQEYANDHMMGNWWVAPVYAHMAGDDE